ncbi:ATP-binding cassette domain-containing protein, partial [Francisellaceae bacterium]|nr:ATP-binding cassette domain-containing protein [Francisellaceae bacterium]
VFAPIIGVLISWVTKQFRKLSWNSQNAMSEVTHTAEESMTSYKEIRIFGGQEQQSAKFYKSAHYTYSQQIKTMIIDCASSPLIQFIGGLVVAVAIFIAAYYAPSKDANGDGWISAGSFIVFITSTLALLQPIKRLTNVNSTIQKAIAAAEGLYELLDQPDENDNGNYETKKAIGHYQLKGLEFKYNPTSELVLKGIDLEIQPGQTVAFVGASGGGKTTVVNLLIRFYEATSGEILLDGVNINDYKLANLRDQIAMVSQHVSLFNDTLYNNIAFGKKGDTNVANVTEAAKAAYAWRFIKDLPEGLNTLIGENGYGLSGGQRQRVAIARAILKDAPILILDEATSALDTESERFVQKALDELMVGKTTFVVAHRLSTIENADKIVVMDKGLLAEQGTHDELLAKNGVYANLYNKAKSLNLDAIE